MGKINVDDMQLSEMIKLKEQFYGTEEDRKIRVLDAAIFERCIDVPNFRNEQAKYREDLIHDQHNAIKKKTRKIHSRRK